MTSMEQGVPRGRAELVPHTLDDAVAGVELKPVFQPIVSLPDGAMVGFEALARWPHPTYPETAAVLAHARATGRADQLDRMCIEAAITSALGAGLRRGTWLFVNCEPATAYVSRADNAVVATGRDEFQLMFELTERGLLTHPHALLHKVAALRADGFGVALDDVGAHPDSLALLDVISPDVIKLDLELVQTQPDYDQARTLAAVLAHHERTGAIILAEGIETDEHLEQALALGARLGQGFRFGQPGPLRAHRLARSSPPIPKQRARLSPGSPFDLLTSRRVPVRTARKQTLTAFSRLIESQASHATDPPMVLTALQDARYFTGSTRRNYRKLAACCPLVAVFGQMLPTDLEAGIRGVPLDPADPLCREWTVLTLGAHTAAALIAREHDGDDLTGLDRDRRFDLALTYDRTLVSIAARNLLDRMV